MSRDNVNSHLCTSIFITDIEDSFIWKKHLCMNTFPNALLNYSCRDQFGGKNPNDFLILQKARKCENVDFNLSSIKTLRQDKAEIKISTGSQFLLVFSLKGVSIVTSSLLNNVKQSLKTWQVIFYSYVFLLKSHYCYAII